MKKLLTITNIKLTVEDTRNYIPMHIANNNSLVQIALRHLAPFHVDIYGELRIVDLTTADEDQEHIKIIEARQQCIPRDADYSNYLNDCNPNDGLQQLKVFSLDHPDEILIVVDAEEYDRDCYEKYDHNEADAIYCLLLEYCPMHFIYQTLAQGGN